MEMLMSLMLDESRRVSIKYFGEIDGTKESSVLLNNGLSLMFNRNFELLRTIVLLSEQWKIGQPPQSLNYPENTIKLFDANR
jgi:hypothetical protein